MEENERLVINAIDETKGDENRRKRPGMPGCPEAMDELVEEQALFIAATFVSDAIYGRLEEHRTDVASLRLYRSYKKWWAQLLWKTFIYVDLFLAFIEPPYTITPPFTGLSAVIETVCMLALVAELVVRFQFLERRAFFRSAKIIAQTVVITATLADVMLSSATGSTLRLSRYLRPWFLFYSSRLLRTATHTIRRIVFHLFDLLLLIVLAIILYGSVCAVIFFGSEEGLEYFSDLLTAYVNFYFGLYSVNFPDIMIPAYHDNPAWALLFLGYVLVVSWFLMAIVLATIYTVYKSGLKGEVAQVLYHQHQRLAAAWQLFGCHITGKLSWSVWAQLFAVFKPQYSPEKVAMLFRILDKGQKGYLRYKEFLRVVDLLTYRLHRINISPHIFGRCCPSLYYSRASKFIRKVILHKYASWAVDGVIVVSVVILLVELQLQLSGDNIVSEIRLENHASEYVLCSVLWFEFFCRLYALGPKAYWRYHWHKFDMLLLAFVSTGFSILLADYDTPIDWVKVIFIGRLLRLTRLFSRVGRFQTTLTAIHDVIPALRPIFLTQVVLYYLFALVGMQVWAGKISKDTPALKGTAFIELGYYSFNFNSFLEALLTLFHLNVINNYNVTAQGYVTVSGVAAWLFFVIFNLLVVIVMFNVMVAFILEAFQKRQQQANTTDPMLKRIRKVTSKFETREGGSYAWTSEDSRDPFHILRRLLLDEILEEEEAYGWLNYVDEQRESELTAAKLKAKKKQQESDSDSEPENERGEDSLKMTSSAVSSSGGRDVAANENEEDSREPKLTASAVLRQQRQRLTNMSAMKQSICRGGTIYVQRNELPRATDSSAFASWDDPVHEDEVEERFEAPEEVDGGGDESGKKGKRRKLGVVEIGGKIRHAWMRQWHGKGTETKFYIPRITRDRGTNNLRVVWEDQEEEYHEHLKRREAEQEAKRRRDEEPDIY